MVTTLINSVFRRLIHLPRRLHKVFYIRWNRFLFRVEGVEYGRKLQVYGYLYLCKHPSARITIGNNFTFLSGEAFNPFSCNIRGGIYIQEGGILEIGDNSGISASSLCIKNRISIGNNVGIGANCILLDSDAHNLDYRVRNSCIINEKGQSIDSITAISKPIIIEDDVLVGTRCIIMKGVTIGARSVIGAGSVVTKSLPADCVAAGNPAQVIRFLN